jgi:hypothetical protein
MKDHGRKYLGKPSYPIAVWNGILEHRDRMGSAVWEFLWCLDRVTREKDGVGLVLGGKPVKIQEIVDGCRGSDPETVRLHLKILDDRKYIRRRRTPYGYSIEVLNSRKFGIWRTEKPQNTDSLQAEKPNTSERDTAKESQRNRVLGGNKEDSAVTQQETQQSRSSGECQDTKRTEKYSTPTIRAFSAFHCDRPFGHPAFQQAVTERAKQIDGTNDVEMMEAVIVDCRGKVPPRWYEAKHALERGPTSLELPGKPDAEDPDQPEYDAADIQHRRDVNFSIAESERTGRSADDIIADLRAQRGAA